MSDFGGGISLSHAPTSDDDSSEHSPRCVPSLVTPSTAIAAGSSHSKAITTLDHYHHPPENPHSSRKPRGRPPGSKNKPKPPIVITRDSDTALKPVVLEISPGSDIIETVIAFARGNHVGLCVINASGTVSNITLRHPVSHAPALSLHGPFGLLSLSGTFFGASSPINPQQHQQQNSSQTTSSPPSCFGVTLAAAQGQVFGGLVAGKMTAATNVMVMAATFVSPAFHRLPIEEENEEETKPCVRNGGGDGGGSESCSTTVMSMAVYANQTPVNGQITPDVMPWGPSRPY